MGEDVKKKLYNTRQLLKNYTYLKRHTSFQVVAADEIPYVKGVQLSQDRTSKAIECIDSILEQYKELSNNCPESLRRYTTIYNMYLIATPKTIEEIAEINNCSLKTVTRDRDRAIGEIAVLLFGIDGLELH